MDTLKRLFVSVFACALLLLIGASMAIADSSADAIPPGTVITMQNWQKYKQFFSDGELYLWSGQGFWKMPPDVQIPVKATHIYPLPQPYVAAGERYGGQTRLERLPNGLWKLDNYIAGPPFPNPSGPNKGTEIAADVTYRAWPYIVAGFGVGPDGRAGGFCSQDRFGSVACNRVDGVYRQLAFNWMPGVPRTDPKAGGAWYSEWLMVEEPEQAKYTADLTIFYQDNTREESNYVFIPALRRSLRLSVSARCAPLFGSDMTHDDQRVGWNGGVGMFDGRWLRDMKLLSLTESNTDFGKFPQNYDMPLGWSKPSWGSWELRDVWVVEVRRIPTMRAGYCYGKRVMYVDKASYQNLAEDLYDQNLKLWKVVRVSLIPGQMPPFGTVQFTGFGILEEYWDVQNEHVSHVIGVSPSGHTAWLNSDVPAQYNDVDRYSTPGGLMQIMR